MICQASGYVFLLAPVTLNQGHYLYGPEMAIGHSKYSVIDGVHYKISFVNGDVIHQSQSNIWGQLIYPNKPFDKSDMIYCVFFCQRALPITLLYHLVDVSWINNISLDWKVFEFCRIESMFSF